jgi:hypothetical protein
VIAEGSYADTLLDTAVSTLIAYSTMAQNRVYAVHDLPTRPDQFPMLMLQVPAEKKISLNKGVPTFNTTVKLEIVGRVVGTSPGQVSAVIRQFKKQIESALLCDPNFVEPIQQFTVIGTQMIVSADGKQHNGEIAMSLEIEIFQIYEPNASTPLTDIRSTITDIATSGTLAVVDVPFT